MQITCVNDIHQFDKLKMAWGTVYSADPHAHIFVSWAWLGSFFEVTPYHRFVLGLQPDFENNCLWLPVLWQATTPIEALAAFVDRQKKTFSDYIGGFNDRFAKPSPGKMLLAYNIRYAIENGFKVYDFLKGDEAL